MLTDEQRATLTRENPRGVVLSSDFALFQEVLGDKRWRDNAVLLSKELTTRIKKSIGEFLDRDRRKELRKADILTKFDHTDTALEKMGNGILSRVTNKILEYLGTLTYPEASQFISSIELADLNHIIGEHYRQLMQEYQSDTSPKRKQRVSLRTHDQAMEFLATNPLIMRDQLKRVDLPINYKQKVYDILEIKCVDSQEQEIQITALDRTILHAMNNISQSIKKNEPFTIEDVYRAIACKPKAIMSDRAIRKKADELDQIHRSILKLCDVWVRISIQENKGTMDRRKENDLFGKIFELKINRDYIRNQTSYIFTEHKPIMLQYAIQCKRITYFPYHGMSISPIFKNPSLENYVLRDCILRSLNLMIYQKAKPRLMFETILDELDKVESAKSFQSKLKKKISDILENLVIEQFIHDHKEIKDKKDKRSTIGWTITLAPDYYQCFTPNHLEIIGERNPQLIDQAISQSVQKNPFSMAWDQTIYDYLKKQTHLCQAWS